MAKKKETQAERRARERQEMLQRVAKSAPPAEENKQQEAPASPDPKTPHKSFAKVAVKSVIIKQVGQDGQDVELVMTAFGKGNAAILEKRVQGGKILSLNDPENFSAKSEAKQFLIGGTRVRGECRTDDPRGSKKAVGMDLIGAKDALEMRYFGTTFADNIHIQLIYNILDIEKLLAVHVNNIVYSLDNILHRSPIPVYGTENKFHKDGYFDIIGSLGMKLDYADFSKTNNPAENKPNDYFKALVNRPQLAYFGNAFYRMVYDEKAKKFVLKPKSDEEIFYILCMIGMVRNSTAHAADMNLSRRNDPCVALYTMESDHDEKYDPNCGTARTASRKILDGMYNDAITPLNRSFLSNSKKNLTILFRALGITDIAQKREIVRDYYDFAVRKGFKNLGFSIKKLREQILELPDAAYIKGDSYNTVRSKLYGLFDFVLFRHYVTVGYDGLVERLRTTVSEPEKEAVYKQEAKAVWATLSGVIKDHVLPFMSGEEIKAIEPDPDITEEMLTGIILNGEVSYFSKIMHLLTMLIDGKEINDLLTTLVNKFDNIASFLTVMKAEDIKCQFKAEYTIFANSAAIKDELRVINSFARMQKLDGVSKKAMYIEAAQVLGAPGTEKELSDYFEKILKTEKVKGKNGLRNFIASNVIDSARFKYLVRYNRPETVRAIAQNRAVILFVLKELPETMITRYYNACRGVNRNYSPDMAEYLADLITGFSFESVKEIDQKAQGLCAIPTEEFSTMNEKQKKQAAISLYLMVLYQVTKNMVYINSRYYMAFHCLERDAVLLGVNTSREYAAITRKTLDEERGKKRARAYLQQNLDNSDKDVVAVFRNQTEHLNAVRDAYKYLPELRTFSSYYEMYHYVMQRSLMETKPKDREEYNEKTQHYFDLVRKYKTYCKDFTKALCVPFGYNLPRFKNLSIDGLFDMNRPSGEKPLLVLDEND